MIHSAKNYLEASFGTRLQVRFNVTWVQVGDAHQEARPSESPQFTEAKTALWQRLGNAITSIISLVTHSN